MGLKSHGAVKAMQNGTPRRDDLPRHTHRLGWFVCRGRRLRVRSQVDSRRCVGGYLAGRQRGVANVGLTGRK